MTHLLADLDWVDIDFGCSTVLLGQHCSCSTGQRPVEHPKSKSTIPRSARRWVTLYILKLLHIDHDCPDLRRPPRPTPCSRKWAGSRPRGSERCPRRGRPSDKETRLTLEVLWFRDWNRFRNWIFIIFQKLVIPVPIPVQGKIDFCTVLELISVTGMDNQIFILNMIPFPNPAKNGIIKPLVDSESRLTQVN